jgi:hypothetical protein
VSVNIILKSFESAVYLMQKTEHKVTFFGTTVYKMARVHHLQKMSARSSDKLSDHSKKIEMNVYALKILNFCLILVLFPLILTSNVF